jgi:hypothetical protein
MKYMNSVAAAAHFGLSKNTLKVWRNGSPRIKACLIEGVHWVKSGERSVLYNVPLLEDWLANRKNNPEAHQRAIDAHRQSLPSHQP